MKTADRLESLEMSKIRMLSAKVFELQAQGREMYMFTLGQPDFPTPKYICEACKKAIDEGYTYISRLQWHARVQTGGMR